MSIARTLWTDWIAMAASVGLSVWLTICFVGALLGQRSLEIVLTLVPLLVLAGIVAWRLARTSFLFRSGVQTEGAVVGVSLVGDRGRLDFAFQHQGQAVHTWTAVHKTKAVKQLQPGQKVDVLFDPRRPRQAIVKSLYTRLYSES